MKSKSFVIPLTVNRHIIFTFVPFIFENKTEWQCLVSDEFMNDMERFFDSGHYKLHPEKQIQIYDDEDE